MVATLMSTSKSEGREAYKDPLSFTDPSYRRGKKSDVFSLGVILWEISSGKLPCKGFTMIADIVIFRLNGSRDEPVPGTPEKYIELYSECWDKDPDKRPSCEEIYKTLEFFRRP